MRVLSVLPEKREKINGRKTQEMRIDVLAASSSTVRVWIKKSADVGSFVIPNSNHFSYVVTIFNIRPLKNKVLHPSLAFHSMF